MPRGLKSRPQKPKKKMQQAEQKERLQKILARAGLASRRKAEELISGGRVRINGEVVRELGTRADPAKDKIEVEGWGVVSAQPHVYIALYKPVHVVSTVRDPEGRRTVLDLLHESRAQGARKMEGELPRVFPVGRLDFDAEGIILMTNDGELSNKLTHPRTHVPKTYMVKVKGRPEETTLDRLRKGVRLRNEDGTLTRATAPAGVKIAKQSDSNTWLELTLFEGRYHQVKRMCDAIGHRCIRLVRRAFGGIEVEPLGPGAWRFLSNAEIASLRAAAIGDDIGVDRKTASR
jgi:23S rRNA pseudouridine2605 synthase